MDIQSNNSSFNPIVTRTVIFDILSKSSEKCALNILVLDATRTISESLFFVDKEQREENVSEGSSCFTKQDELPE